MDEIECPCCGMTGAVPAADGWFHDGQSLECGCEGSVRIDCDGKITIAADYCVIPHYSEERKP